MAVSYFFKKSEEVMHANLTIDDVGQAPFRLGL